MTHVRVSDVRLARASARSRASGLVGIVSCTVNGLRICVALRQTLDGRHTISFPRRHGRVLVLPVTPEATRALERRIIEALGLEVAP